MRPPDTRTFHSVEASAAIVCRACRWFGVFGSDVAQHLRGCPNCGGDTLELRDVEDESWPELGAEILGE